MMCRWGAKTWWFRARSEEKWSQRKVKMNNISPFQHFLPINTGLYGRISVQILWIRRTKLWRYDAREKHRSLSFTFFLNYTGTYIALSQIEKTKNSSTKEHSLEKRTLDALPPRNPPHALSSPPKTAFTSFAISWALDWQRPFYRNIPRAKSISN